MSKQMLIDAAHPEETRVVVLDGNRIEEFDFESRAKKQLRGNIYLAKVTRVEPSLQAAFVEYGGNRHGFLAFNEIHPDYFQIPHADREALMREADADDDDDLHAPPTLNEDGTESLGGEDEDEVDEEVARRRRRLMRRYKIQEVIKRRQIMLIQVVKEERGNKGAALTTYLSLAGRYCVLMPNTDRGGGISRKIAATTDRKRLRNIVQDLDVPTGMGLIVRTAGAKRTRAEIKRDYEYLSRAWSSIRDTTLHSIAPSLIYEEEDLVKRAIRDLYDKDLEAIWVEGHEGYREAKAFMRMLMPAQAKKIQLHTGPAPLFVQHKIETLLSQIYTPNVPLKSGGYLVINQTEALVAVDVNSGRATRERNIEATALKTNMEAAEEAARQFRLRDLAGLLVIDFIDMDEAKNNRAVEKVLKDALAQDRARIQMGRISSFGLMEISRQRRRGGILEGTTHVCPHCAGAGRVRSVESSALSALRAVEMEALNGGGEVTMRAPRDVGLYILNQKREYLTRVQQAHALFVNIVIDDALAYADFEIERTSDVPRPMEPMWAPAPSDGLIDDDDDFEDEVDEDDDDEDIGGSDDPDFEGEAGDVSDDEDDDDEERPQREQTERPEAQSSGDERRRGRRRRRGKRGEESQGPQSETPAGDRTVQVAAAEESDSDGEGGRSRRRRGRRGGRRMRDEPKGGDVYAWAWPARLSSDDAYEWRGPIEAAVVAEPQPQSMPVALTEVVPVAALDVVTLQADEPQTGDDIWVELPAEPEKKPKARRSRTKAKPELVVAEVEVVADVLPEVVAKVAAEVVVSEPPTEPAPVVEPAPTAEPVEAHEPTPPDPAEITAPPSAPKRGWWRRG